MATRAAAPVLSLEGVALGRRRAAARAGLIDFELARGQAAIVEVDSDDDASFLVDVCVGLADPPAGVARFLDRDWRGLPFRARLAARGRIGTVVLTQVWPAHLSIAEAVLTPRLYHTDRPEAQAVTEATALARMFDLPGLPAGRRETTPAGELIRAACVRGFLGLPELVIVQDPALDDMTALGVAMAQAVAAVQDHGGGVLWITGAVSAVAARYVRADHVLRLGEKGLVPVRRSQ